MHQGSFTECQGSATRLDLVTLRNVLEMLLQLFRRVGFAAAVLGNYGRGKHDQICRDDCNQAFQT